VSANGIPPATINTELAVPRATRARFRFRPRTCRLLLPRLAEFQPQRCGFATSVAQSSGLIKLSPVEACVSLEISSLSSLPPAAFPEGFSDISIENRAGMCTWCTCASFRADADNRKTMDDSRRRAVERFLSRRFSSARFHSALRQSGVRRRARYYHRLDAPARLRLLPRVNFVSLLMGVEGEREEDRVRCRGS